VKVTELNVYPVKSFKGVSVQSRLVDDFGLEGDRRWMLVDEYGRFVSQRRHPQMALLNTRINSSGDVSVVIEGDIYPLKAPPSQPIEVTVWSDTCLAWSNVNPALDDRLSSFLGLPVKLVYMPVDTFRQVDRAFFADDQRVSFTDGYPLLLLNEASLCDLNSRLPEVVTMSRFRGNIVVSAELPFAEDKWKRIEIGEVAFAVVKPCSRCVMTTVDPSTGIKGTEPLKTLSMYRKSEHGIIFGQNIVQLSGGVITVGDRVKVLE
jgi:hypothetical protein